MKKTAIGLTLCLLAGGCGWLSGSDALPEMTIQRTRGSISIQRGSDAIAVEDRADLHEGDVVVTGPGSEAELRLVGRRALRLRGSGELEVADGDAVEALAGTGDLLVRTEDRVTVSSGDVDAVATHALFRVDRGRASMRVGSYRGRVGLTSPGEGAIAFGGLRQAAIAAGDVQPPRPYALSYDDPWDNLLLSDVIELDKDISALADAAGKQLGRARLTLTYFKRVAKRDVSAMRPFMSSSSGNLLVGFSIASSADGPFERALRRAFSLFRLGGQWGVVAALLDVRRGELVASLEDSILATGALADVGGAPKRVANDRRVRAASGPGAAGDALANAAPSTSTSSSSTTAATGGTTGGSGGGATGSGSGSEDPGGSGGGSGGSGGGGSGGGGSGGGGGGGGGDGCDNLVDCTIEELPLPSASPTLLDDPLD